MTERIEPHFVSVAAFNAAFTGEVLTVHRFYGAAVTSVETSQKWHILKELVLGACPQPTLSAEEQLAKLSMTKGETWTDFVD